MACLFYCTRCEGTGFLNLQQVPAKTLDTFEATGEHQVILDWIDEQAASLAGLGGCFCNAVRRPPCSYCESASEYQHDVSVCDCCGDGEHWHGEPGQHDYEDPNDPCGCR